MWIGTVLTMKKEYNFYSSALQDQYVVQWAAWPVVPLCIICMMQNSLDLKKGLESLTSMGLFLTIMTHQNVAYSNGSETQSDFLWSQLCIYHIVTIHTRIHLLLSWTCTYKTKLHPSLKKKTKANRQTPPPPHPSNFSLGSCSNE